MATKKNKGLWFNIRKRRKSGKPPAKPGDKNYPSKETWDKLTKNEDIVVESVIREIKEALFKPGLKHHIENNIPLTENIYRVGSECYFNVIKHGREMYKIGLYETVNPEEIELFENSELGEWVMFEGEKVPLDFPMYNEDLNEEEKKDPPLNKPTTNAGSGKKWKVYVRDPKTGNVKKVTYGDKKGGLKGNWNDPEARKSFAARHNCAEKKDKTKSGYWACRAHKDFGKNVPGRFW